MESSESSEEERLSDLSSPAASSSSAEESPQTHLPSKRKQGEVPIGSEEEIGDKEDSESSGRTASRSLSCAGAGSSSRENSVSCGGRERVFADGVPFRSTAPRPGRKRKARSKSLPPAQDRRQARESEVREETGDNHGGSGVDYGGGGDDDVQSVGAAGAASQSVWFEEEEEEPEAQRDWAVRTEREYRAYVEGRPFIAAELLQQEAVPGNDESGCSSEGCQGVGVLRCQECTGGRLLCAACDERHHPHAHFHHRSILKAEGFWAPLSPTQAVINGQLISVAKCFSLPPLHPCVHCKQTAWGPAQASNEKWAVITLDGRFDFHKAAFKCETENCPCVQIQDGAEALQLGFWVGTVTKVSTLYSMGMLKHWDKTQKHMPGAGLSAFVKILEETGQDLGREGRINRHTLGLACSEFKFAKYEFASLGRVQTGLECPACYLDLHSVISDGNRKLYRWDRSYAMFRDCYYGELLIFDDESVLRTLTELDSRLGVTRPDAQCGTGEWKAARDTRSAIRGQAETGAVFCGCRHQVGMKAVNLVRSGERFGHTYFLDRHFIEGRHPRFFWQDIVCKYWPWREKALEQMGQEESGSTKPALNIMHGKLHSWECQAVFGGRWQDGAGAGSGEDMEMYFSYMSRFGIVTKNMGPARRGERITEATLHWNADKRARMAQALARRLDQSKTRTVEASQELEQLCQETLQVAASEVSPQKFRDWKREVQDVAKEQLNRSSRAPSAAVKYFTLVTEVEAARELEAFRHSVSFEDSLLCSNAVQQVRSLTAEVTKDLRSKEKKLEELERGLFVQEADSSVSEEARQRLLEASRTELAEHTILGLQIEVEALLHSLEKFKLRIASEADSAKMRASMRKKEGEVKKQVEAAVGRYNVVIQKGDPSKQREPASASDLLAGAQLPWQFEGRPEELLVVGASTQKTVTFKRKVELVEAFNFLQRLKEETSLLAAEQRSVLAYYSNMVRDLSNRIEFLDGLDHTPLDDNAGDEGEPDSQPSRYWVTKDRLRKDRVVRSGCRALFSRARAAALARLEEAKASFPFAFLETTTAGSHAPESAEPTAGVRIEEEFAHAHQGLEGSELARFQVLSDCLGALGQSGLLHRLYRCGLGAEQLPDLSPDLLRTVNYFSEEEITDLFIALSSGT